MVDVTSHLRDAGFNDAEITAWATDKRNTLKAGGFSDGEVDDYFGAPKTPEKIPPALIDRIRQGTQISNTLNATAKGAVEGFGDEPVGFSPENIQKLRDLGVFANPDTGEGGPIRFMNEALMRPAAQAVDTLFRAFPVVTGAIAGGVSQIAKEAGVEGGFGEGPADRLKNETFMLLNIAGLLVGAEHPMTRIEQAPGGRVHDVTVGGLPKGEDFSTAATAIGHGDTTPAMEAKLGDLYEQKGLHPAEVAHDAQSDVTITQSILSSDKADMPAAYGRAGGPAKAELLHGYNSLSEFSEFKPLDQVDDIHRYDGGAGVFGRVTYLSTNARWISGEEGGLGIDSAVRVQANFDNLFTLRPDNVASLRRIVGDQAIGDGVKIADALKAQGYDGISVKGFDGMSPGALDAFAEKNGIDHDVLQNQVAAFAPEKSLKAIGKVDLPERPSIDATDAERAKYRADYENVVSRLKKEFPDDRTIGEDILNEGKPQSGGAAATPGPTYSDAEQQVLSKISIGEKSPESKLTWGKLYTNFLDKLYPIGKAVKETAGELPAEENPYQLARLLTGHVGKADHFLNEATFDFHSYEQNGPSLKSILAPVNADLNGFRAYATAARALELEERGIKSGFDAGEATSAPPLISAGLDAPRTVVVEGREKFAKPFMELVDYQNRVSQYLRDSGVVSEAGYKAMVEANQLYVPFTRVMGIDEAAQARGGSTLQAHNPLKAIKGSARSIVDPIESIVRNTYHFLEMAEKNVVGTKLVDMLKGASEGLPEARPGVTAEAVKTSPHTGAIADELGSIGIKKPDELAEALGHASAPTKPGEIAILRDGKRETYNVDPDLARAMKGLDAQSMGLLEKALSYPASTLRAGAVTTPDFALRHTVRDFLYAMTTFKGGVFSPVDMAKGFSGLIMKDGDYWNWLKGGGGNISMVGMDRQYLQADLRKLTGETGLAGRAWNVLTDPDASMWGKTGAVGKLPFQAIDKFVLDPLRALTQFAENASHLGAFKKTMRRSEESPAGDDLRSQIIRAAWASRDTAVDAARMGANMRAYNMITAFANIKLQDTDRVVRAIKDDPITTLTKIGAAITVPSVVLWAANHDDPRYAEIPQWQKDMFWIVMTPDHVFRVPKPWAMGMIFGSGPERLLDAFVAGKPDAFKEYFKSLWAASGPDFVPTAGAPIIDQFANRSTFTNRTLIPSAQEKILPEYQYTPYTTEVSKAIGQTIGAFPGMSELKLQNSGWGGVARAMTSPILIENYVRGWTGTLGTYALQAADKGLRMAGKLPDPPQPASTLADIPVIRAFVVRYPSASAESIQHFYDQYDVNKKYFDTWNAMAKDGNVAAMTHIQQMGGPMMFAQLDAIKQTLTEHNQIIRDVYKNPDIPPAEKRQLIDTLYGSMIAVSRGGNDAIRQMREQAADVVSGAH